MTSNYQSKINLTKLWRDLERCEIPWKVDGTGVIMGNGQSAGLPIMFKNVCRLALNEIECFTGWKAKHIMLNRLPAGCHVPKHVDPVKEVLYRYHLPLVTSRHAYVWDERNGLYHLSPGWWHPLDYTIPHAIGNFGTEERVHLIVDLIE